MVKLDSFSSFFVANWKLNGNLKFIDQFIDELKIIEDNSKCIVICPTTIYLDYISHKKKNFFIGAQNVSQHIEGSFTGEISCESLTEFKSDFCIVGHSERRKNFWCVFFDFFIFMFLRFALFYFRNITACKVCYYLIYKL